MIRMSVTVGAVMAALLAGICLLAQPLGSPEPQQLLSGARGLWRDQPTLILAALSGIEASTWLHLIQDGDPALARSLTVSREAIWGILADAERFKAET